MSAQLAILGLLMEQPLHGYGIDRLVEQRGMRKWTAIGFSSIYALLDQLVADGLASVSVEPAPARGKERRVHSITDQGRELWQTESLAALADPGRPAGDFLLAFSGVALHPQARVIGALRQRRDDLNDRIADLERDRRAAMPYPDHVEAMFDYTQVLLTAEHDWLDRYLESAGHRSKEKR